MNKQFCGRWSEECCATIRQPRISKKDMIAKLQTSDLLDQVKVGVELAASLDRQALVLFRNEPNYKWIRAQSKKIT